MHQAHPEAAQISAIPLNPASAIRSESHAGGAALRDGPQASAPTPVVRYYVDLLPLACLEVGYLLGAKVVSAKPPSDSSSFEGKPTAACNGPRNCPGDHYNSPNNRSDPTGSIDPSADAEIASSQSGTKSKGKGRAPRKTPRKKRTPKKRPRRQTDSSDDGRGSENGSDSEQSDHEHDTVDLQGVEKSFACHFLKLDPQRYHRSCSGKKLYDISRLKQHIKRSHCLPPNNYCPTCFKTFKPDEPAVWREHARRRECKEVPSEEVDHLYDEELKTGILDTTDGLPHEEKWRELWTKLFPKHAADCPLSPYDEPSETELHFTNALRSELPSILGQRDLGLPPSTQDVLQDAIMALVCRIQNPPRRFRHKEPQPPVSLSPPLQHPTGESPSVVLNSDPRYLISDFTEGESLADQGESSAHSQREASHLQWNQDFPDMFGGF